MNARVALVTALIALAVAVASLGVALHRPASAWPMVCGGQQFTNSRTGITYPIYYPCSPDRP